MREVVSRTGARFIQPQSLSLPCETSCVNLPPLPPRNANNTSRWTLIEYCGYEKGSSDGFECFRLSEKCGFEFKVLLDFPEFRV